MLKGKTIVLGISGGIAAYKACELTRRLVERKADVHVILTKSAKEFVTPLTFQALSGHPVHTDLFNLTQEQEIGHISLADRADAILVAPATADLIARTAHGLCDDLLTTVLCATTAPVLIAPSMNVNMWNNKITQENVEKLKKHGFLVIEPEAGYLACGYNGKGRLPDPETLLDTLEKTLSKKKRQSIT